MQRLSALLLSVFSICFIGINILSISTLAGAKGFNGRNSDVDILREQEEHLVEVEPTFIVSKTSGPGYELMPYSARRKEWGSLIGISANFIMPSSYIPDQSIGTYSEVYEGNTGTMVMFEYTKKKNYDWGSMGLDLGFGMLSASGAGFINSTLTLSVLEVGAVLSMDNIGKEPLYVPYVGGGGYIVAYKEEQASSSFNGTTQVAPYMMIGLLIQLNRLDETTAFQSYLEAGIENTFIFLEARKYFKATGEVDPNFETDLYATVGFKMEL